MRQPHVFCLVALSFALSTASNVFGQEPAFGLIDFPGASSTQAWGINARIEIVGAYNDGVSHGYYLHRGNYAPIDHPGATFTNALGISPRGDIVGRYVDASGRHGYVLRRGEFTTIDYPGAAFTGATAIDPEDNIVGRTIVGGVFHGFVLSREEWHEGQSAWNASQVSGQRRMTQPASSVTLIRLLIL